MKSNVFLLIGILIIGLIVILAGAVIYNVLKNENISPDDVLYCLEDSDCVYQAPSCGSCACPGPINTKNQIAFKCVPLETSCTPVCLPNTLKCLNHKCTLVQQ